MSSSVVSELSSGLAGKNRKYNIDKKFLKSPYLSNPFPIGKSDRRRKCYNSPRGGQKSVKSSSRRHDDPTDVESVLTRGSARSYRTSQTSLYQRSLMPNNVGRLNNMKNMLLPSEVDMLFRRFRQKYGNHPIVSNCPVLTDNGKQNIDDSTIASDFALSIDDEQICRQCTADEEVRDAIFSGDLFAALTMRHAEKQCSIQNVVLPHIFPIVDVEKSGDVSDLESIHSVVENLREMPT